MAMALTNQPVNSDPLRPRGAGQPQRRLDRWVNAGRQLVDGVAGTRPGGRGPRTGMDGVGRWVGERIDWLLEDGDDWREPWQEQPVARPAAQAPPARAGGRRNLEAISRRGRAPVAPAGDSDDGWPDDGAFTIPRWQRPPSVPAAPDPEPVDRGQRLSGGRPLPRSSRRREV